MSPDQLKTLIQIRERLMIQLAMISRLIDYFLAECHGKPELRLSHGQGTDIKAELTVDDIPEDTWYENLDDYEDQEEDDGEDY